MAKAGKAAKAESGSADIQVECSETGPVTRSVSVEVPASRVNVAFEEAYKTLRKTSRIKGFRPGKTPRSVLERMYGQSLPEEIERVLVMETLSDAIERADVQPVSEPTIDADRPEKGSVFRYTASVEVKPTIELPDLTDVKASKPVALVSEEQVQAELERLRERNAPLIEEAEDVEAAQGHTLTIDYLGRIDGEPFEGGTGEGMDIELGSGGMVPGFEDQLMGARAGEDRQVEITFPEDYGPAELNGKQAVFDCHVVAVRRRDMPELDDEFAKDLGEFETLEELRDRIRSDQTERAERQAEQALQQSLMSSLIELTDFEVPPGIVDRQLQSQMRSLHSQYSGRVPDDVLQGQLQRMQESGRPTAERSVREMLLLEALAEAHEVVADDEEVDERLREMAEAQGMEDAALLRKMAEEQGWLDALASEVRDKKIYDLLAERAQVEDVYQEPGAED